MTARLYDKTEEVGRVGGSWLEERWGERQEAGPVWRVEFQIRRAALVEFKVRSPAEVLAAAQALWTYGTGDWLTLRRPTSGLAGWRWPLEASWAELQGVRIAPTGSEAVRRRLAEADRERALRFLQGHLTTWGALGEVDEIEDVLRTARAAVVGYLAERGRTFRDEVRHKRARRRVVEAAAGRQRSPEGTSRTALSLSKLGEGVDRTRADARGTAVSGVDGREGGRTTVGANSPRRSPKGTSRTFPSAAGGVVRSGGGVRMQRQPAGKGSGVRQHRRLLGRWRGWWMARAQQEDERSTTAAGVGSRAGGGRLRGPGVGRRREPRPGRCRK